MQLRAIQVTLRPWFLCLVCLLVVGCEEIVDDPGTLPYEEKLVIRGIVEAGKRIDSILITRTLPPLDAYEEQKAWVHDALVLVRHNGITDTLPDRGRGLYYKPGIIPQPGEVYELVVVWNNKQATAITRVPQYPEVLSTKRSSRSSRWGDDLDVLSATVKPYPGEVYSATYSYRRAGSSLYSESPFVQDIYRATDTSAAGLLVVTTDSYNYSSEQLVYQMTVQAYDEAYHAYFTSYRSDNDDVFEQNRNVKWNVRGDGIGMFIGISRSPRLDVN